MSETNVTPLRTLDDQVRKMHRKFDKLIDTEAQWNSAQVEAGLLLLDIRQRVESGEAGDENAIKWWEWYQHNFPQRGRSSAEKLLAIAAKENPQAAYVEDNARHAQQQRDYRERQKQTAARWSTPDHVIGKNTLVKSNAKPKMVLVPDRPRPVVDHAKIEGIIRQFLALSIPERRAFATRLRQVYKQDVVA